MALRTSTVGKTFGYVSNDDPCKKRIETPIDPNDAAKGVNVDYQIEEGATTFHLRSLDVFVMSHIYDNSQSLTGRQGSEDVRINTRLNQTNVDAVRFGLAAFDNFKDENDSDVRVTTVNVMIGDREYTVASDDTLRLLSITLIQELAGEIKSASEVSKSEEKKSGKASSR